MAAFLPNQWAMTRGTDSEVVVHILDVDKTPLNISGASGVFLRIKNSDGTINEKAASTGFAYGILKPLFIYGFLFSATETQNFPVGANQAVELKITYGSFVQIIPIANSLNVGNSALS